MKLGIIMLLCVLLFTNGYTKERKYLPSNTVIAHRGYWNISESFENSISSFENAVALKIYGSEFDVNLTADDSIVVAHGPKHPAHREITIQQVTFKEIRQTPLPNGELVPSLYEYLNAGIKRPKIHYILEIKTHKNTDRERTIVQKVVEQVKKMEIENRVTYISFSWFVCLELKKICPNATIYYLNGDKTPQELKKAQLSGLDYHYSVLYKHPEWITEAHNLGLKVNVWTVDKENDMRKLLDLNVDYITTNTPELLTTILKEKKYSQKKKLSDL